ncbi:hypothetical protein UlMin_045541 [Ulmus minor]
MGEVKAVIPESLLKKTKRAEDGWFFHAKELIQLKREAKLQGGFYVEPEAKLLFIIFNGLFLKVNKAAMNMLYRVEPYVTYGDPVHALGKHGIHCMEDLVYEIVTVGPRFKEANNFLWPFKLKAPLGGLKKRRNQFVEGRDARNRKNHINELICRMN